MNDQMISTKSSDTEKTSSCCGVFGHKKIMLMVAVAAVALVVAAYFTSSISWLKDFSGLLGLASFLICPLMMVGMIVIMKGNNNKTKDAAACCKSNKQ